MIFDEEDIRLEIGDVLLELVSQVRAILIITDLITHSAPVWSITTFSVRITYI